MENVDAIGKYRKAVEHFESLSVGDDTGALVKALIECAEAAVETDKPHQGESAALSIRVSDHSVAVESQLDYARLLFGLFKEKRASAEVSWAAAECAL